MEKRDEDLLLRMELGVTNAQSVAAIGEAIKPYGYGPERLDEGRRLVDKAKQLDAVQQKEYGEQRQATVDLKNALVQVKAVYKTHVDLARIALPTDASAFTALQLGGSRKVSTSGCIVQISSFYINILGNNSWQESIGRFGVNRQDLENAQQLLHQAEQAYSGQMKEMGEAQSATKERDAAIDAAHDWYSPFIKVARIALAGNTQLLEMLGITAR